MFGGLTQVVAQDEWLLALAGSCIPGQQPASMLMAAAHLLVRRDPSLPLAAWFASVTEDPRRPEEAGPVFTAFCHDQEDELRAIPATRLVQTSAAGRGVAVRVGLHAVARRVDGPVTLLEVGPGTGLRLRFDHWAVELEGPPTAPGRRRFAPAGAPVVLTPEWRGDRPVPDPDAIPDIADRFGVDLHPVDVTDPDERAWLEALVWPEDAARRAQLDAALAVVAADPPEIHTGDAVELLPRLDVERLRDDVPVVVWHSMVRAHVPRARRPAFDAVIAALGERRRLLNLSLEFPPGAGGSTGHLLRLGDSAGPDADLALVHGHGRWIQPLA